MAGVDVALDYRAGEAVIGEDLEVYGHVSEEHEVVSVAGVARLSHEEGLDRGPRCLAPAIR